MKKGIFKEVDVLIDTTAAYKDSSDEGIQVIFKVKERGSLCGEAKTEMSNTEKPRWLMRIISPNLFGRGESLSASFSHSLSSSSVLYQPTDFSIGFTKPYQNDANMQLLLLQQKEDCPWAQYDQTFRGFKTVFDFPLLGNQHSLEWQGMWRELACSNVGTAFEVRQQMGHSLKSSLLHTMVLDRTDDAILPKRGFHLKLTEEFAGLGGDVKFIKERLESSLHATLFQKITLGLGFQAGFLLPYGTNNKTCITDKFFIGGPLTLRGFETNSVGNETCGNFIGSNAFWMVGGHIYTPLPFYWSRFGRGSWLDNFRFHGFVNAGNAFDIDFKATFASNAENAKKDIRLSYGFGLVYKFMNAARFELNFCIPIKAQSTDRLCDGVQFGIGVSSV
ncbi:sorting and assembly machinery component 50 homolog A-like isoform X2 [Clavelina lepadiformis]